MVSTVVWPVDASVLVLDSTRVWVPLPPQLLHEVEPLPPQPPQVTSPEP